MKRLLFVGLFVLIATTAGIALADNGGTGDDRVVGTRTGDVIFGGPGNDVLLGRGGDDAVFGGIGDDFVSGGFGADFISGGAGFDTCVVGQQDQFQSCEVVR